MQSTENPIRKLWKPEQQQNLVFKNKNLIRKLDQTIEF